MSLWESVSGMVEVELTGAQITKSMEIISNLGFEIKETEIIDALSVRFKVSHFAYSAIKRKLTKQGDSIRILKREGVYWSVLSVMKRPVLIAGLLVLLFSSLYIPNHIYFVRVQGNQRISSNEIISAAEICGVYFGASSRDIRSEIVKNRLLESMPQLQWAAINTRGCVATIQVREREVQPVSQEPKGHSSIVASRDGVIAECVVFKGNLACKPGQAVKAGDLLISGFTKGGMLMKYEGADGEILAQTKRQLDVIFPNAQAKGVSILDVKKEYALRIGKNIIKFSKDSGISDTSCGKMYEEKYMELPGGFQLPIAWICQTSYVYSLEDQSEQDVSRIEQLTDDYLQTQMVGGTIITKDVTHSVIDGAIVMQVRYDCMEMIGKKSDKEILQEYGQTD